MNVISYHSFKQRKLASEATAYLRALITGYFRNVAKINQKYNPKSEAYVREVEKVFTEFNMKWETYANDKSKNSGFEVKADAFFHNVMHLTQNPHLIKN